MKKEKIKHIVETKGDDLIDRKLCEFGKFCIIGELLHFAGVSASALEGRGTPTAEEYELLYNRFGLRKSGVGKLMGTNDACRKANRKSALLLEVERIAEEDPEPEPGVVG